MTRAEKLETTYQACLFFYNKGCADEKLHDSPSEPQKRYILKVGLLSNLDFYLDKAAIAAMGGGGRVERRWVLCINSANQINYHIFQSNQVPPLH